MVLDARERFCYLLLRKTLDPFGSQSSVSERRRRHAGSRVEQCAFRVRKHPAKVNKCEAMSQTPLWLEAWARVSHTIWRWRQREGHTHTHTPTHACTRGVFWLSSFINRQLLPPPPPPSSSRDDWHVISCVWSAGRSVGRPVCDYQAAPSHTMTHWHHNMDTKRRVGALLPSHATVWVASRTQRCDVR